jgi:hypothetical protein
MGGLKTRHEREGGGGEDGVAGRDKEEKEARRDIVIL